MKHSTESEIAGRNEIIVLMKLRHNCEYFFHSTIVPFFGNHRIDVWRHSVSISYHTAGNKTSCELMLVQFPQSMTHK